MANFDLMVSMPACGTLKNCRLVRKSCSFSERAPAMKLTCLTSHPPPWWRNVLLRADLMNAYWSSATRLCYTLSDLLPFLLHKKDTPFAWVCLQDILLCMSRGHTTPGCVDRTYSWVCLQDILLHWLSTSSCTITSRMWIVKELSCVDTLVVLQISTSSPLILASGFYSVPWFNKSINKQIYAGRGGKKGENKCSTQQSSNIDDLQYVRKK